MDLGKLNLDSLFDGMARILKLDKIEKTLARFDRPPLTVRPKHCSRTRFSGADACAKCRDICPTQVVTIEPALDVDFDNCLECSLCATVCPTGAIDSTLTEDYLLAKVKEVAAAGSLVFRCARHAEPEAAGQVVVPCLGRLTETLLVGGAVFGAGTVAIDTAHCDGCEVGALPVIKAVTGTARSLLAAFGKPVELVHGDVTNAEIAAEPLVESVGSYSRRDFFLSVQKSLMVAGAELVEGRLSKVSAPETKIFVYRLSRRRELLLALLKKLGRPVQAQIEAADIPFASLEISDKCVFCDNCVLFCPTKALRKTPGDSGSLDFTMSSCTNCGVCKAACFVGAITTLDKCSTELLLDDEPRPLINYTTYRCESCGQEFGSTRPATMCHFCRQREAKLAEEMVVVEDQSRAPDN